MLKDSLTMLLWWPEWVAQLKDVVKFFRSMSYRVAINVKLKDWLSATCQKTLTGFSVSFAKWRWQTVYRCCKAVRSLYFIVQFWPELAESLFKDAQDKALLKSVGNTLLDGQWWRREKFVGLFSSWCEHRRKWGH